tara:strand:+ start:886 stop:1980 length:1095 start_codon:yes stop_codon:yes gene_type:complete
MKIKEITQYLENIAPLAYQEAYDNSGLIVGDKNNNVNSVLITLDCTEDVIDEAINNNCNLIISHHPIIFTGIKSITGSNYVERTIIKAIKNNIAIYSIHTNLDNVSNGVSAKIAEIIGLDECSILAPKRNLLRHLVVYSPYSYAENIRSALFAAGAGKIGNYDKCSFSSKGNGTYRANKKCNPYLGKIGELHKEKEERIEVIFPIDKERDIINSLKKNHPYEEVAYQIYVLDNLYENIGSGIIGILPDEVGIYDFLDIVKIKMKTECIRYTNLVNKKIKKVAICGGSGSFLISDAVSAGADIFITSDVKYHDFFDADNDIIVADIGHYESEQFTKELIYELLSKKFSKFAIQLSKINTNPINYL